MKNNSFLEYRFVQFFLRNCIRLFFVFVWISLIVGFILLSHVSQHFAEKRSLSIYMWPDKIDESILQKFEQETGIKIYVNYYESNEELVTKFEIAKDLHCDIILPSEHIIKYLVQGGFLKKIDRSRCDFIHRIHPDFMGKYFDPNNEYSFPIYWDMLGLGYTKSYFPDGLPLNSWNIIFDKELVPCKQIGMIDDSREAIFLAMRHLCADCAFLDDDQLKEIITIFINQKSWVGAYTDFQQGYFLTSKTYPLVVCQREIIARAMLAHDDLAFTIPDEGSLLLFSNVVICASSEKDDLIYQFLNYMYKHEVLMHNCKQFSILPTVTDVLDVLPQEYIGVENILPGQPGFDRLELFLNVLTQKQINDVWIAFKSF